MYYTDSFFDLKINQKFLFGIWDIFRKKIPEPKTPYFGIFRKFILRNAIKNQLLGVPQLISFGGTPKNLWLRLSVMSRHFYLSNLQHRTWRLIGLKFWKENKALTFAQKERPQLHKNRAPKVPEIPLFRCQRRQKFWISGGF